METTTTFAPKACKKPRRKGMSGGPEPDINLLFTRVAGAHLWTKRNKNSHAARLLRHVWVEVIVQFLRVHGTAIVDGKLSKVRCNWDAKSISMKSRSFSGKRAESSPTGSGPPTRLEGRGSPHAPRTTSATRSPTTQAARLVLCMTVSGKTLVSATSSPSMPCTRSVGSTTLVFGSLPMRQVPDW